MRAWVPGVGVGLAVGVLLASRRGAANRREAEEAAGGTTAAGGEQPPEVVRFAPQAALASEPVQEERESPSRFLTILNTATREELLSAYGMGPMIADQIMRNRPYQSEQDVVNKRMVPAGSFDNFKRALTGRRSA